MDITSSLHQRSPQQQRPTHNRSSSFSGLLSILSPSSASAPKLESTQRPSPQSSVFTGLSLFPPSGGGDRVGLGIDVGDDIDPDKPLPTFEVQPTMLAVDLSLLPGESRSCASTLLTSVPCN